MCLCHLIKKNNNSPSSLPTPIDISPPPQPLSLSGQIACEVSHQQELVRDIYDTVCVFVKIIKSTMEDESFFCASVRQYDDMLCSRHYSINNITLNVTICKESTLFQQLASFYDNIIYKKESCDIIDDDTINFCNLMQKCRCSYICCIEDGEGVHHHDVIPVIIGGRMDRIIYSKLMELLMEYVDEYWRALPGPVEDMKKKRNDYFYRHVNRGCEVDKVFMGLFIIKGTLYYTISRMNNNNITTHAYLNNITNIEAAVCYVRDIKSNRGHRLTVFISFDGDYGKKKCADWSKETVTNLQHEGGSNSRYGQKNNFNKGSNTSNQMGIEDIIKNTKDEELLSLIKNNNNMELPLKGVLIIKNRNGMYVLLNNKYKMAILKYNTLHWIAVHDNTKMNRKFVEIDSSDNIDEEIFNKIAEQLPLCPTVMADYMITIAVQTPPIDSICNKILVTYASAQNSIYSKVDWSCQLRPGWNNGTHKGDVIRNSVSSNVEYNRESIIDPKICTKYKPNNVGGKRKGGAFNNINNNPKKKKLTITDPNATQNVDNVQRNSDTISVIGEDLNYTKLFNALKREYSIFMPFSTNNIISKEHITFQPQILSPAKVKTKTRPLPSDSLGYFSPTCLSNVANAGKKIHIVDGVRLSYFKAGIEKDIYDYIYHNMDSINCYHTQHSNNRNYKPLLFKARIVINNEPTNLIYGGPFKTTDTGLIFSYTRYLKHITNLKCNIDKYLQIKLTYLPNNGSQNTDINLQETIFLCISTVHGIMMRRIPYIRDERTGVYPYLSRNELNQHSSFILTYNINIYCRYGEDIERVPFLKRVIRLFPANTIYNQIYSFNRTKTSTRINVSHPMTIMLKPFIHALRQADIFNPPHTVCRQIIDKQYFSNFDILDQYKQLFDIIHHEETNLANVMLSEKDLYDDVCRVPLIKNIEYNSMALNFISDPTLVEACRLVSGQAGIRSCIPDISHLGAATHIIQPCTFFGNPKKFNEKNLTREEKEIIASSPLYDNMRNSYMFRTVYANPCGLTTEDQCCLNSNIDMYLTCRYNFKFQFITNSNNIQIMIPPKRSCMFYMFGKNHIDGTHIIQQCNFILCRVVMKDENDKIRILKRNVNIIKNSVGDITCVGDINEPSILNKMTAYIQKKRGDNREGGFSSNGITQHIFKKITISSECVKTEMTPNGKEKEFCVHGIMDVSLPTIPSLKLGTVTGQKGLSVLTDLNKIFDCGTPDKEIHIVCTNSSLLSRKTYLQMEQIKTTRCPVRYIPNNFQARTSFDSTRPGFEGIAGITPYICHSNYNNVIASIQKIDILMENVFLSIKSHILVNLLNSYSVDRDNGVCDTGVIKLRQLISNLGLSLTISEAGINNVKDVTKPMNKYKNVDVRRYLLELLTTCLQKHNINIKQYKRVLKKILNQCFV